jgi:hypothetical protein
MKIMTKFDFPAGKPLNMRQKTGFLSSGVNGRTSAVNGRTSAVNGRTSAVNGRTSAVGTRGFARGIERKAQIKPEVFTVLTLKKWGAQPPRLRFDASRVERFIGQPINRGKLANCSSRAHQKINDEASLTAREARALPKNFNVLILKNRIQRVVYTDNFEAWRSLRLGG